MTETTTTTEDGLSLDQSIALQQFKNFIKKKSTKKSIKESFKNPGCQDMARDCITTPGTDDPIRFDLWYAHWATKWNKIIKNQTDGKWAHYALKEFALKRHYDDRNKKN